MPLQKKKKKKAKSDVFKIKNSFHCKWLYFSAEKYINLFFFLDKYHMKD